MINTIMNGAGINVINGIHSALYIDMTRPSAGLVRYNNNHFEVYDGNSWMIIPGGDAQVTLDGVTLESLQWVRRRMEQEKRLEELARQHPAVADAAAAVARAQEQLDIVTALVQQ
jgi:hypothetical protein